MQPAYGVLHIRQCQHCSESMSTGLPRDLPEDPDPRLVWIPSEQLATFADSLRP